MAKYGINFNVNEETFLFDRIIKSDDPILLAVYCIYSAYNEEYKREIYHIVEKIISEKKVDLL